MVRKGVVIGVGAVAVLGTTLFLATRAAAREGEEEEGTEALPFDMEITKIDGMVDKYATAYWLMEVTATLSNPHNVPVTQNIYCAWAYGVTDPDLSSSYYLTRVWEDGKAPKRVTLNPSQSVKLISPYYYKRGEIHPTHGVDEWSNLPTGFYYAGVRKKYWFRMVDGMGNWSPVASIGSYV